MTPKELREIGERLYGPDWINEMAEELPITPRAIRYWLSGERRIRPLVVERIESLMFIKKRPGRTPA